MPVAFLPTGYIKNRPIIQFTGRNKRRNQKTEVPKHDVQPRQVNALPQERTNQRMGPEQRANKN